MSIFSKPVSQLEPSDIQELLDGSAQENVRLEFKREAPGKDETLKKLSSFANTFGGFTVIGADADSKDGRVTGLPGIPVQAGYKQTLVQWCSAEVYPPLTLEVSDPIPTPNRDGKVCYVVHTPESDLAPHFLNGRKGVYIRTDEFSSRFNAQFVTESELRRLLERRKIVRERRAALIDRARGRFQWFAEQRYRDAGQGKEIVGARFDLALVPRYPTQPVCDHSRLLSLIRSKTVDWRGTGFPRDLNSIVSQHESAIALQPGSMFSILEVNVWGLLFYATEVEETRKEFSGIHLNKFIGNVLVFTRHASSLLGEIGYFGPLRVEMMMRGMRGVRWVEFASGFAEPGKSSELDDEFSFHVTTTSDDLIQRPEAIAKDLLRIVFFATNWPLLVNSSEKLEKLIGAGYEFNQWRGPNSSRP